MAQKYDSEVSTDIEARENDTSLGKVRAHEKNSPFAGLPPSDSATPKNLTQSAESSSRHQIATSVSRAFNTGIGTHPPSPDKEKILYSDASSSGWGGHLNGQAKSGQWSKSEKKLNIQQREFLAICKLLDSDLSDQLKNGKVLLKTDNSSVVEAINDGNKGNWTRHKSLESICKKQFDLTNRMHIEIKAEYIPRKDNAVADQLSQSQRIFPSERSLHKDTFQSILNFFKIEPSIDLFASAINNKLSKYVSKYKDPKAIATNAFSLSWDKMIAYAFPPDECLIKTIKKIEKDKCTVLLVADKNVKPHIEHLLLGEPFPLGDKEHFLTRPGKKKKDLFVFKLSGLKEMDGDDKDVVPTGVDDHLEMDNTILPS